MKDVEKVTSTTITVTSSPPQVIMPGVTHWHHPHFHAYFPTANSYPGIGHQSSFVSHNWEVSASSQMKYQDGIMPLKLTLK